MSSRPRLSPRPTSRGAASVWLIALLVALVATVQIRSEAEVERSLVGIDTTSLAFLIDDLHRANDSLQAESIDLSQRKTTLESGGSGAADQVLTEEAKHLRALEGLLPVHGPGVVIAIDATGLTALDLQDALNNLVTGGAEAIAVNDRRVVAGVPIEQSVGGVAIDGVSISAPWTITMIGDSVRIAEVADAMTQQLRADRRVRQASYRVEADVAIRAVVSQRPFVYAVGS
jgi:uncharacterized protein YlxW (UPF0749 family)